jgi:site-specific DNA-methyltransferase (adenine-specific)
MQRELPSKCVDLIYLDPPFNSKKTYNLMYRTLTGKLVPEQAEAFCDTWEMDAQKEEVAKYIPVLMREHGVDDYYAHFWLLWMKALRHTQPHLLAYLIYMVQRLLYMKILLKDTGSIYLHCDPTVSHYIKVMMDGIFGHQNFRNEIVWCYDRWVNVSSDFQKNHDIILRYSKTNNYHFNIIREIDEKRQKTLKRGYTTTLLKDGTRQLIIYEGNEYKNNIIKLKKSDKFQNIILRDAEKNGTPLRDWWRINILHPRSKERLGYPTQKPRELLNRIIQASSNKGDVVFDPFCGCGTTIYSAIENDRKWIGCDIAILAIKLIKHVLKEKYKLVEGVHFKIDGIPISVEQAEDLFKRDPFQFQHWLVERVDGFPMQKKVADKGIDGRLYFETSDGLKEMVLSVKGGNIRPTDLRDLRGVLDREKNAVLAGFLSLQKPKKAMKEEATSASTYNYNKILYDKIQLLTVEDILVGKKEFHTPAKIGVRNKTGQANPPP